MWPFVMAVVYRRLRGAGTLAEDASQEVFIRLTRSCPFTKLQDTDAFRRYLWRVADNVARTYNRRVLSQRTEVPTSDVEAVAPSEIHRQTQAEDRVDVEEFLHDLLADLDQKDREIIKQLMQGRRLTEIARETGVTYSNAGVRLHRLRRHIRKYLFNKESGSS